VSEVIEAYPLSWPAGWRRTPADARTRARFNRREQQYSSASQITWTRKRELTVADSIARTQTALESMGLARDDVVISTNLPTRLDGMPRSGAAAPADPGAAVYWTHGKATRCMAIDRYDTVAGNLAAIAATLEHMRAIDRHGGAEILDRAFTGFTALPQPEQWWQVLGVTSRASRDEIDAAYRRLAMEHHPDRGGNDSEMARINGARDQGYEATA